MSLLAALLTASLASTAAPAAPAAAPARQAAALPVARRDRWRNTLSLGLSVGFSGPLGVLGAFVEYRPYRWVALSVGGGSGGTFGPAVAGSAYVDPLVLRAFSLGIGASWSHNFSLARGAIVPGRPNLPEGTNWASVELQAQLRPSRRVQLRLGVGRTFLLDTPSFRVASEAELSQVQLPTFPVPTPVDAVRAAARGEVFGLWYAHFDLAVVLPVGP